MLALSPSIVYDWTSEAFYNHPELFSFPRSITQGVRPISYLRLVVVSEATRAFAIVESSTA